MARQAIGVESVMQRAPGGVTVVVWDATIFVHSRQTRESAHADSLMPATYVTRLDEQRRYART